MKILICEDNEDTFYLLKFNLERVGHEVKAATNVDDAIELFWQQRNTGKDFDAIVTDIYMPKKDGFAFSAYVRGAGFTNPIVILSAGRKEEENIREVGAHFLQKPDGILGIGQFLNGIVGRNFQIAMSEIE